MNKWLFTALLFCLTAGTVLAAEHFEADGSVLLPMQKSTVTFFDNAQQRQLSARQSWQQFVALHGDWSVQWNTATATPHRAFGPAIKIPGYHSLHSGNIEQAAAHFLESYSGVLKTGTSGLRLVRAQQIRGRWYVSYRQQYRGLEVLLSEVELRIFNNGNVMAFGVDVYPIEGLSTTPGISFAAALESATRGLLYNASSDKVAGNPADLYVLPRRDGDVISYHLVYRLEVQTADPIGNFITYVDAHSGEIIWRHNLVREIDTDLTVVSDVQEVLPTEPYVERPLPSQYITIDGQTFTTDAVGSIVANVTFNANYSMQLRGPWVNVNRQDGPDAQLGGVVAQGDSLVLKWSDANSHPAERVAFYHTNIIHDFITALDPQLTGMDYEMPCAVNINNTCNAFWNGTGINFYLDGGGCPNTGQMPAVVYHEYGHGINQKLYQQAGSPNGMINGSANEGTADVAAAMIEDNSQVGRGWNGPGTWLRNLDNEVSYPEDVVGEVHADGEIIGGAVWDLRVATDLQTATDLSHFAKWGTPDDADLGICYSEWFLEVLIADDDDGDLSNGTPNFTAINSAFNNHGIGTSLFIRLSFTHTPLGNTLDSLNAYSAEISVNTQGVVEVDSVDLFYSLDGFQSSARVSAVSAGNGTFSADIPAQSYGSVVRYYISVYDPVGGITTRFPAGNTTYTFAVGYGRVAIDEMENESGWVVGAGDDDATTGIWIRMDPEATSVGSQPEDDNTENGTDCYVTDGRAGSGAGEFDVDGGKTTLFSPVYDMSALQNPILSWYKWYSNNAGATPGTDFWVVEISNDGSTWIEVENTNASSDGWEKVVVRVSDYVQPNSQIQLRFIASDEGAGSLVEACVDDFELLAVGGVTGIGDEQVAALPERFMLDQNYPNPFNPETTIGYSLPEKAQIRLSVYNLLGQEIRSLANGPQVAGRHSTVWDGRDQNGNTVASGVYLYRLEVRQGDRIVYRSSRKLMMLK